MSRQYYIGDTFHYIEDHPFVRKAQIPEFIARVWLDHALPEHKYNPTPTRIDNWENKGGVVVGHNDNGYLQVLYRSDSTFYLYQG